MAEGDDAWILHMTKIRLRLVVVELERNLFQVEDNIGSISTRRVDKKLQDAFKSPAFRVEDDRYYLT